MVSCNCNNPKRTTESGNVLISLDEYYRLKAAEVFVDTYLDEMIEQQIPLVKTGQGEFEKQYNPKPRPSMFSKLNILLARVMRRKP